MKQPLFPRLMMPNTKTKPAKAPMRSPKMNWFNRLFSPSPAKGPCTCLLSLNELDSPSLQDTISSIDELSLAVHNNPDAVEIYLALGNLYRSKGELEQATHIRNNIILRPFLYNIQLRCRSRRGLRPVAPVVC